MTTQQLKKKTEGFTIIEVLIVLAIAGLILLIVFLAVPALQRNSRNTTRNNEAARISAAISECLANRNADKASCNNASELQVGTLRELSIPAGDFTDSATTALGAGTETSVVIGYQRACNTAGSDDVAGSTRRFAIMFMVEPNIPRCLDS
jgi:prepilin-type N-terminal cleavage/methylation domain-containing protein